MAIYTLAALTMVFHLLAFALSAAITLPSPLSSTLEADFVNTSIPTNTTTLSPPLSFNVLPPTDPYVLHLSPTTTLILSEYGPAISPLGITTVLLEANEAVVAAITADGSDAIMAQHHHGFDYADALLSLLPAPNLTWGLWGRCLQALREEMQRWESVQMHFEIREEGRVKGVGLFARILRG